MPLLSPDVPEHLEAYNRFLSEALGAKASLLRAQRMKGGDRHVLWRLGAELSGEKHEFVLRTLGERSARLEEAYPEDLGREFRVINALRRTAVPVPRVWGLDAGGGQLGAPVFLLEHVDAVSLSACEIASLDEARRTYLDAVIRLANISGTQLGRVAGELSTAGIRHVFASAKQRVEEYVQDRVASDAIRALEPEMRHDVATRFGNGDLWPSNFLVSDHELVAVVDFEFAGFFDPLLEFVTVIEHHSKLQGRGLEEEYCERLGVPTDLPRWYRRFFYVDTWAGYAMDGSEPSDSEVSIGDCRKALEEWLTRGQ